MVIKMTITEWGATKKVCESHLMQVILKIVNSKHQKLKLRCLRIFIKLKVPN